MVPEKVEILKYITTMFLNWDLTKFVTSELIQYLEAAFLSSLFECTQNLTLLKLTKFSQK